MRVESSLVRAASISAALTALFCVGFGLFLHPAFESGDDPSMALIAAGMHGIPPSEIVVFSNILIGFLLKALYARADSVNWHGVGLYAVLALALGAQFFAVLWRGTTLRRVLCCLAIAAIAVPYWMTLQFTTVTVWAVWSGAWLFLGARDAPARVARAMLAVGIALLLAACLIRIHAAAVGLLLMAPWLIDGLWPPPTRRMVAAGLVALGLVTATSIGDFLYYRARPEWQEWLAYNRARAELHDRPNLYRLSPERWRAIQKAGWSRVDTFLFQRGVFFDTQLYDIEHLEAVAQALGDERLPLPEVWDSLRLRLSTKSALARIALPIVLFLCFGWRRAEYLARTGASVLILLALALWLLSSYKLDDRWLRSMIDVIPIASMMWLAVPPPAARRGARWLRALGTVVLLLYARQVWTSVPQYLATSEQNALRARDARDALKYLTAYAKESERHGQPIRFVTLGRAIKPEQLHPLESMALLRDAPILRFGWYTHSPHYRTMLERHGLTDVYTDAVRRSDVLVISAPQDMVFFVRFLHNRRGLDVAPEELPDFPESDELFGSRVYRLWEKGPSGLKAKPQ